MTESYTSLPGSMPSGSGSSLGFEAFGSSPALMALAMRSA